MSGQCSRQRRLASATYTASNKAQGSITRRGAALAQVAGEA